MHQEAGLKRTHAAEDSTDLSLCSGNTVFPVNADPWHRFPPLEICYHQADGYPMGSVHGDVKQSQSDPSA